MATRTVHEVTFPRFDADIISRRRTLFHVPVENLMWSVGEEIRLITRDGITRCEVGILTSVRQVRLLAELDADLPMLGNVDRVLYLASWDALHHVPSITDPTVWRIEFRYGIAANDERPDPPEWSLGA